MGFSVNPGSAPQPPGVRPVNIGATEDAALTADIFGHDLSNADYLKRMPGLVRARDANIQQSYKQLTGPLDPTVQNAFVTKGLGQSLGAFGQGGEGSTGVEGIGRNTLASSLASDTMGYQDNARSNLDNLLSANPELGLGLSGEDAANIALQNIGTLNSANQQAYAAKIAEQNARISAKNQQRAAATAAGVQLTSAVISAL